MTTKEPRAVGRPAPVSDELLYDVRLVERYISRGLIDREAVEQHCRQLPDMADHAQPLMAEPARPPATKG